MTGMVALLAALLLSGCIIFDEQIALGSYISWVNEQDQERERQERARKEMATPRHWKIDDHEREARGG